MVTTTNGTSTAPSANGTPAHHSPKQLAHVVLRTPPENFQPMIQFYRDVLDATIVHQDAVLAFLRYDEEHHRIAIINTPDTVPKPNQEVARHAGLDHIAFTYPTLTQPAQQYIYLKSTPSPIHPLW